MLTIHRADGAEAPRHVGRALGRGARCRCPACGEGRLFSRFLKVAPACEVCGTEFHHHRADDLPPYLTMAVVGHIVVWFILIAVIDFELPLWVHVVVWPALTLALSLALLQPIKGAVIALQWALRMHGFGGMADEEAILRPAAERETAR